MTTAATPRRGADGRYHYLYVTYDPETLEWYGGKHSANRLDDGYRGSGDWIRYHLARDRLITEPIEFFASEEAVYAAETDWLTMAEINDQLCQNKNEGGDGRTSEGMRRTLARPEIKLKHRAGVLARWAKPDERARTAAAARVAFENPEIRAKYFAASRLRWGKPEELAKHSARQRARFAKPEEREKQSARIKAAATPERRAQLRAQAKARWDDPATREKYRAAAVARWSSPEARKQKSEAMKAAAARPELQAKIKAGLVRTKAQRSASVKAVWADPERKAKLIASLKVRDARRAAERALRDAALPEADPQCRPDLS